MINEEPKESFVSGWTSTGYTLFNLDNWQSKAFSLGTCLIAFLAPAFFDGHWIAANTQTVPQRLTIALTFVALLAFINWSEDFWHQLSLLERRSPLNGDGNKLLKLFWLVIRNAFSLGYFLLLRNLGTEVFIVSVIVTSLPSLVLANATAHGVFEDARNAFYVNLGLIGIGLVMLWFFNDALIEIHPEFKAIPPLLQIVKPTVIFACSRMNNLTYRMFKVAF